MNNVFCVVVCLQVVMFLLAMCTFPHLGTFVLIDGRQLIIHLVVAEVWVSHFIPLP
jgi:hypothetical protein